jgi:GMP synthase (glutamine-hydrolysing)
MQRILILDFGSQTTQLIGRRIREIGVFSEIIHGDADVSEYIDDEVKGIILSGSPFSVYEQGAPQPSEKIWDLDIPVLGICYGFQRLTENHGGKVKSLEKREYGRSQLSYTEPDPLFENVPDGFTSWMSHGDSIEKLADGFGLIARSEHHIAAACNKERKIWGIQFHPEVTHCEHGNQILENFAVGICGCEKKWSMEQYLEKINDEIREISGDRKVLLLISGGVDSTVVGGLLLKALHPDQVYLMYIDTGLMRKDETAEVESFLNQLGAKNLFIIHAEKDFLGELAGHSEPEKKREIIGDLFVTVQEREIKSHISGDYTLAQGTLYTDMIESGKGVGNKAQVIKSHHNVRSPLIEAKRERGEIIEPLSLLYKDEVRKLGSLIGLPDTIVNRHPFPGPGLAVRILGEITREKCDILREADYIFIDQLKKRNLYNKIWQAFCVLLPIRSVGVAGDVRKYGYVLALRAIISRDGMTADVYPFDGNGLLEISALITNSVPEIGRVVYDVSSKPPATIEWE